MAQLLSSRTCGLTILFLPIKGMCINILPKLDKQMDHCARLAYESSKVSQEKFSTYFDLKAKSRNFKPNDEALILLPDNANKLLVSWKGPFKVKKRINKVNYIFDCNATKKIYHINLLKQYFRRSSELRASTIDESNVGALVPTNVLLLSRAPVLDEDLLDSTAQETGINFPKSLHVEPCITSNDSRPKPIICDTISSIQTDDLGYLINLYSDVFSNLPGHTKTVTHTIILKRSEPVCSKLYLFTLGIYLIMR